MKNIVFLSAILLILSCTNKQEAAIISYEVTLNDSLELPEWIDFDESKLLISGRWETKESVILNITAIDEYGNKGILRVPMETKSD